jgi:homoserine dehydrogenase
LKTESKCRFAIHPKRPSVYNLEGKDNMFLFYTDRYVDFIDKGAGAGAAVSQEFLPM